MYMCIHVYIYIYIYCQYRTTAQLYTATNNDSGNNNNNNKHKTHNPFTKPPFVNSRCLARGYPISDNNDQLYHLR